MGLSGISITSLILIVIVVVLIFGTKKLRNMGGDVGGAVKNFREAMKEEKKPGPSIENKADHPPKKSSAHKKKPSEVKK